MRSIPSVQVFKDGLRWVLSNCKAPFPEWASLLKVQPDTGTVFIGGEELKITQVQCSGKNQPTLLPATMVSLKHPDQSVDQHDIAFHPKNTDIVYAANDAGVYRSEDGGFTWNRSSRHLKAAQFYDLAVSPLDPEMIGGGMQDRGTWIRQANQWTRILYDDGGYVAFDPVDKNTAWGQTQHNHISKVTLHPLQETDWIHGLKGKGPFISVLIAVRSKRQDNPSTYLYTGRQHVFRDEVRWVSTNTGGREPDQRRASWQEISPPLGGDVTALAVDPRNGELFAGTSTGEIWWSDLPARKTKIENWIRLTARLTDLPKRTVTRIVIETRSVHAEDRSFYACFGGINLEHLNRSDHVVRCSTGGVWTSEDRSKSLPNFAVHGLVVHPTKPRILFISSDVGVYRSENGGDSWHRFSHGLPNVPCLDITLSSIDPDTKDIKKLRVATHGRGIYELPI